jgi:hypothetical protein
VQTASACTFDYQHAIVLRLQHVLASFCSRLPLGYCGRVPTRLPREIGRDPTFEAFNTDISDHCQLGQQLQESCKADVEQLKHIAPARGPALPLLKSSSCRDRRTTSLCAASLCCCCCCCCCCCFGAMPSMSVPAPARCRTALVCHIPRLKKGVECGLSLKIAQPTRAEAVVLHAQHAWWHAPAKSSLLTGTMTRLRHNAHADSLSSTRQHHNSKMHSHTCV